MNTVTDAALNMFLFLGNPGRRAGGEPSSASSGHKKKAPGGRPGRVSPQEAQKWASQETAAGTKSTRAEAGAGMDAGFAVRVQRRGRGREGWGESETATGVQEEDAEGPAGQVAKEKR